MSQRDMYASPCTAVASSAAIRVTRPCAASRFAGSHGAEFVGPAARERIDKKKKTVLA